MEVFLLRLDYKYNVTVCRVVYTHIWTYTDKVLFVWEEILHSQCIYVANHEIMLLEMSFFFFWCEQGTSKQCSGGQ